jgi:hypothetical protein
MVVRETGPQEAQEDVTVAAESPSRGGASHQPATRHADKAGEHFIYACVAAVSEACCDY